MITAQQKKMKFSIRISSVNITKSARKLRIWSQLLKKSCMGNFSFCAVDPLAYVSEKNPEKYT